MKSTKGITLIALVITIIVLLILAGVSISLIVGNNGVLSQASNSVTKTNESDEKEQVEMAYLSAKMLKGEKYLQAVAKNDLETALSQNGITDVIVSETSEEGKLKVEFTNSGNEYTIEDGVASKIGTTTGKSFASQIDETNYGDYVDYGNNLGIVERRYKLPEDDAIPKTDWRIFYKDDETGTVFLIASDYLSTDKFPEGVFANNNGKTTGWWSASGGSLTTSGTVTSNNSFLFGKLSNVTTGNLNYQATATLLDSNKWSVFAKSEYVDDVNNAVIGSPTVEMWIESWNDRYKDTLAYDANSTGYQVGLNSSSLSTYLSVSNKIGYDDTLYFPHKFDSEYYEPTYRVPAGYWLASPVGDYGSKVMGVVGSGGMGSRGITENYNVGNDPWRSAPSSSPKIWNHSNQKCK